jgi:hypothetical protein
VVGIDRPSSTLSVIGRTKPTVRFAATVGRSKPVAGSISFAAPTTLEEVPKEGNARGLNKLIAYGQNSPKAKPAMAYRPDIQPVAAVDSRHAFCAAALLFADDRVRLGSPPSAHCH